MLFCINYILKKYIKNTNIVDNCCLTYVFQYATYVLLAGY